MSFLQKVPLPVWLVLGTLGVVVGGAIFLAVSQKENTGQVAGGKVEGETVIGQEFTLQGAAHINPGAQHEPYNSNPPSSGPHYATPAKNGVYDTPLVDETLIHDLEHGYIWIAYRPDVSQDVKDKLKKFMEDDDWKMVLAPREQNDAPIALVAWGRVLKLNDYDEAQIKKFRDAYRNRGPEKTPS